MGNIKKSFIKKKFNKIEGYIYIAKRTTMWYIRDEKMRYSHIYIPFVYRAKKTLFLLAIIVFLFFMLYKIGVIEIDLLAKDIINIIYIKNINYSDIPILNELVIVQISITFLTTTILSLVSNIDKKYVLGERVIDLIFKSKGVKFNITFLIIYFLMFINIVFMITETYSGLLLIVFFISLFLLIYIINSIGKIFISTSTLEKELTQRYYLENMKVIDKPNPSNKYKSNLLISFNNKIINGIIIGDNEYIHNLDVCLDLFKKILFKSPKVLEEYHIDSGYKIEISNIIIVSVNELIKNKKMYEAIELFYEFLSNINYHKVFVSDYKTSNTMKEIINHLNNVTSHLEAKEYIKKLEKLIAEYNRQVYFCDTNDFSYTRLFNSKIFILFKNSVTIYEKIYSNIYNNNKIDDVFKKDIFIQLYEVCKMSAFYSKHSFNSIDAYSPKWSPPITLEFPPYIIGLSISFMFLRMFVNEDEENLKLFFRMNIESLEMNYAIHVTLLCLIKIKLNNMNLNIYNNYKGVNYNFVKDFIAKNQNILTGNGFGVDLNDVYNLIVKNNLKNEQELSKLPYNDCYFAEFREEYINIYFDYISNNYLISKLKVKKTDKKASNYKIVNECLLDIIGKSDFLGKLSKKSVSKRNKV